MLPRFILFFVLSFIFSEAVFSAESEFRQRPGFAHQDDYDDVESGIRSLKKVPQKNPPINASIRHKYDLQCRPHEGTIGAATVSFFIVFVFLIYRLENRNNSVVSFAEWEDFRKSNLEDGGSIAAFCKGIDSLPTDAIFFPKRDVDSQKSCTEALPKWFDQHNYYWKLRRDSNKTRDGQGYEIAYHNDPLKGIWQHSREQAAAYALHSKKPAYSHHYFYRKAQELATKVTSSRVVHINDVRLLFRNYLRNIDSNSDLYQAILDATKETQFIREEQLLTWLTNLIDATDKLPEQDLEELITLAEDLRNSKFASHGYHQGVDPLILGFFFMSLLALT